MDKTTSHVSELFSMQHAFYILKNTPLSDNIALTKKAKRIHLIYKQKKYVYLIKSDL